MKTDIEAVVEELNKEFMAIIEEFAPNRYAHLVDSDENKGEKFRDSIRDALTAAEARERLAFANGVATGLKEGEREKEELVETCRQIFIKEVDWAEWAMSDEDAKLTFDEALIKEGTRDNNV